MMSLRMFCLLTIVVVILCFTERSLTEAKYEMKKKKNLPSAVVVGSVYCDTCFQLGFSKSSHFISGASVAVECAITGGQPDFRKEAKTNEVGEFAVHLPFSVTKRAKKIKKCWVKLIKSSEPKCAVASLAASSSLKLKSRKDGIHIFSAGFFTFKPPKQPKLCNQTPKFKKSSSKKLGIVAKPRLFFPNPFHTPSLFPPNLLQPPLLFPPNPFQPPSLFPPNPFQPPSLFPPNPFQPPPSLLPPNPLLPPSPPPSLLPPTLLPPITLPPIPGITPSPPPPSPPPPFAIHLPPFPFQPTPGVPPTPPSTP